MRKATPRMMEHDEDKIDDAVLALLYLTTWEEYGVACAWKGFDWTATDRLHRKGYIGDPRGRAKSLVLTEEGRARSKELFRRLFGKEA